MKTDYSIVRQDRFIQATRDSGYKGTDSALSELIDNSIQAGATEVAIATITVEEEMDGPGRPRLPRVMEMVIADNGRGMDAETLRRALRFGDSTRFDDRTGIGRFGMGLPNASVSQCKRVEVYTWRRGSKPLTRKQGSVFLYSLRVAKFGKNTLSGLRIFSSFMAGHRKAAQPLPPSK